MDNNNEMNTAYKAILDANVNRIKIDLKTFIEFVALIVRSKYYTLLKDEKEDTGNNQNYMNVPASIRELEKIEMIRGLDRIYRLDHAVTATPKTILSAFGLTVADVKKAANRISERLKIVDEVTKKEVV